jgi:hypothetical protein
MKKTIIGLVALSFLVLTVGSVFAAWFGKEKAPQQKAVTQTTVTQKQTLPLGEIIAKKKAELNGTEWTVEMKPMGTKGKAETDLISFSEDKVISKNLATLGYAATNFSVRLEEDGTVIWETMQTSEKDGQAFWRGDIKEGVMRGVLSKRNKKGNAYDFSFVSVSK